MSGFYKKAVVWLGLNEEYPDEPGPLDPAPSRPNPRPEPGQVAARPAPQAGAPRPQGNLGPAPQASVRRVEATPKDVVMPESKDGTVRAIPMEDDPPARPQQSSAIGTVRAVALPKTVKPKVIVPQSFNDAQVVADTFREPKPVIVNMQSAERDLARRLIDFSSGLCYGLGGQMEKVAKDVYLLTPDEVEVADEDRDNY